MLTSWGRRGWQEKRQQEQWNGDPGWGTRQEGTHRTADPEPIVLGRLLGAEVMQTGRESELPRQNPCQGARSACSKAGVREEAWLAGVAQGVLVWLGPEQRCRKLRLVPDSAKKWENHPAGHSLKGVARVTLRRQLWLQSRSEKAEPLGRRQWCISCRGASQVVLVVKNLPANAGDLRD